MWERDIQYKIFFQPKLNEHKISCKCNYITTITSTLKSSVNGIASRVDSLPSQDPMRLAYMLYVINKPSFHVLYLLYICLIHDTLFINYICH